MNRRTLLLAGAGAAALLPSALRAEADEDAVALSGDIEKPGRWTPARIARELAAEVREVHYTLDGAEATARCVPLLSLVRAAGPKLDPKRKNHLLSFVVVVRAEDGYTVSFAAGELMPDVGGRQVWLAIDRNGGPLPADDAPARLLIPGEKRPARWVRAVSSVRVLDGSRAGG